MLISPRFTRIENDKQNFSKPFPEFLNSYFSTTFAVATPPRLLRTVMFCGFVETLSSALYWPPPLFDSVPRSAPVELTNTRNVALLLVLVASMRNTRLSVSYSARVILTVSVVGDVFGLIESVALRVMPFNVPLTVALVVALTAVVLTIKLAELAPAETVTLSGTEAAALLLASAITVADGAAALSVTVP